MAEPIGITTLDSLSGMMVRGTGTDALVSRGENLHDGSFADALRQSQSESPAPAFPSASGEIGLGGMGEKQGEDLKEAFQNFVGQTLFSQMISSLRSSQEGSAYFNGGRAEKIFQGQLDQILSEEMTKASASQLSEPMYELFQLQRSK